MSQSATKSSDQVIDLRSGRIALTRVNRNPIVSLMRDSRWTPWILFAAAFGLGAWHLGAYSFWDDEAFSYFAANASTHELWSITVHTDPHNLAWHFILRGWYAIHQGGEAWGRVPAVVFGAATVVATWAIARRIYGRNIALLSAFLLLTSSALTSYEQEGRSYTLVAFLTTIAMLRLVIVMQNASVKNAVLFGASAALALYGHPFAIFPLLAVSPIIVFEARRWTRRAVVGSIASAVIVAGPFAILFAGDLGNANLDWVPPLTRGMVKNSLQFIFGSPYEMFTVVGIAFCAAGIATTAKKIKESKDRRAEIPSTLAWAWLVGGLFLAFAVGLAKPLIVPRYLIPMIPAAAICVALGITVLLRSIKLAKVQAAVLSVLVILLSINVVNNRTTFKLNDQWRLAMSFVQHNAQPNDAAVATTHEKVYEYYELEQTPNTPRLVDSLSTATQSGSRVWVMNLAPVWDQLVTQQSSATSGYIDVHQGTFGRVRVDLFEPK